MPRKLTMVRYTASLTSVQANKIAFDKKQGRTKINDARATIHRLPIYLPLFKALIDHRDQMLYEVEITNAGQIVGPERSGLWT